MNIVAFIVSALLFVVGVYLMGAAFTVSGWEMLVFFGGILAVAAAFFIPVQVIGALDRRR
jgi:di/tricarboxylate transporter